MFWKKYEDLDHNYGYFGIGFMASGEESDVNYPNTFFFRVDDDYIRTQDKILPHSILRKDKNGKINFEIYWREIWVGLKKNKHYKKLMKEYAGDNGKLNMEEIALCDNQEYKKHLELLKLDSLDVVYLPYMDKTFRWTNMEKRYILEQRKKQNRDFLPEEIKMLLNVYRQKNRAE